VPWARALTRERAPIEVRDVHPTHYGRMCPIETPGPEHRPDRLAVELRRGLRARLRDHAVPRRQGGKVTDEIVTWTPPEEEQLIAQANTPLDANGKITADEIVCRTQAGQYVSAAPKEVELMDVSPDQIWSVATAMIPFLEHDDANRALMGSNMQRQAVPLLRTTPRRGHRHGARAALDTGDVVIARSAGTVA